MYLLILGIGLIFSFIKKRGRITYYIFFVVLLLMAVFRYGVGADYFSYAVLFYDLQPSVYDEFVFGSGSQEILFRLIGSVFKSVGATYTIYVACIALVNLVFISKTCTRFSKYPLMSLVLYYSFFYFVWTYSVYRQGLVLTIGIYYLIKCLDENKTKKMVLISMVLSLIHLSGILLILLYLIAKIEFSKKTMIIISAISIGISIIPIGNILHRFAGITLIDRVLPYISETNTLLGIIDFPSVSRIVFIIIGLFYYNALSKNSAVNAFIARIYILGLSSYFIFKFSELTASRLSIYGFYLIILILPNIYSLYRLKFDKFLFFVLITMLSLLFLFKEINTMKQQSGLKIDSRITPYTNIFNKDSYTYENRFYSYLDDRDAS